MIRAIQKLVLTRLPMSSGAGRVATVPRLLGLLSVDKDVMAVSTIKARATVVRRVRRRKKRFILAMGGGRPRTCRRVRAFVSGLKTRSLGEGGNRTVSPKVGRFLRGCRRVDRVRGGQSEGRCEAYRVYGSTSGLAGDRGR